jgi:hypothetical protein
MHIFICLFVKLANMNIGMYTRIYVYISIHIFLCMCTVTQATLVDKEEVYTKPLIDDDMSMCSFATVNKQCDDRIGNSSPDIDVLVDDHISARANDCIMYDDAILDVDASKTGVESEVHVV